MYFGALAMSVGPINFSASLSKTATPSGGFVTSDTVTVRVPGGNSGQLTFNEGAIVGSVGPLQYSKNGGTFTTWSGTVTFANGDTLAVRAGGGGGSGLVAGESYSFTLTDVTRNLTSITYTLTGA